MRPTIPDLFEPLLSPRRIRRILKIVLWVAMLIAALTWANTWDLGCWGPETEESTAERCDY